MAEAEVSPEAAGLTGSLVGFREEAFVMAGAVRHSTSKPATRRELLKSFSGPGRPEVRWFEAALSGGSSDSAKLWLPKAPPFDVFSAVFFGG